MANNACHILQTEVYSSQVVDDTLDTSLAMTAATLEEDLNYIRSVLKKTHGGPDWHTVPESISDLLADFQIEHYTTAENPTKAGQHKHIHAEHVSTADVLFNAYSIVENQANDPYNGANGSSLRIYGPNTAAGTLTGLRIGPQNATEYFEALVLDVNNVEINSDTGKIAYKTNQTSSTVFRIESTAHNRTLELRQTSSLFSLYPQINNVDQHPFEYDLATAEWKAPILAVTSGAGADLNSGNVAFQISDSTSSGGALRFGINRIFAVHNTNQPQRLELNSFGTAPVSTWTNVSATGAFPLVVGNENYGVWHQGNQGHGSGLDADTVDGRHATDIAVIGGSIRNSSPTFGAYHLVTIKPNDSVPTRQEPYHAHYHFYIRYKLKKLPYTFWAKFTVYIVYDSSSGNWVVDAMGASTTDGVFAMYSRDVRLIQGTDILLKKRTVTVGSNTQDYVDIYIQTAANELDIYEITNETDVTAPYPTLQPTTVEFLTQTSTTSLSCSFDNCVAGLHDGRELYRIIAPYHLNSLHGLHIQRGEDQSSITGPYLVTSLDNTHTFFTILDPYTKDSVLIYPSHKTSNTRLGASQSGILQVSLSTTNSTDFYISTYSYTIADGDELDGPYESIMGLTNNYAPTHANGPVTTIHKHQGQLVSDSNMYSVLQSLMSFDTVVYTDVTLPIPATHFLVRSGTSYSGVAQTSTLVGGAITPSSQNVTATQIFVGTNTSDSFHGVTVSSAFVRHNKAVYNPVLVNSSGDAYLIRIVVRPTSSGLASDSIAAYKLPINLSTTSAFASQVRFITEHPDDGTKAIIAFVDTSNNHVKIAFINDFTNVGALSGIDIVPIYTNQYAYVTGVHLLYVEELNNHPIFLVHIEFRNLNWRMTVIIDATDWSYYVLDSSPTETTIWTSPTSSIVISGRVLNGRWHIPHNPLDYMIFNPALAKLDKYPLINSPYQHKRHFGSQLSITAGNLGVSAITVGSAHDTLTSESVSYNRTTTDQSYTPSKQVFTVIDYQ